MVEKFINETLDKLENMSGEKHVLGTVIFHFIYFILLCVIHDLPGL